MSRDIANEAFFSELSNEKYDPLPMEEIHRLIVIVQSNYCYKTKQYLNEGAITAKDRIIQSNMRLAPYVASKVVGSNSYLYRDCINECYTSFEKSILAYKSEEKANFATYAISCARFSLFPFLAKQRNTVHLTQSALKKGEGLGISSFFVSTDAENSSGLKTNVALCHETSRDILNEKELLVLLKESMSILNEKEKTIIKTRYLGNNKIPLREISEAMGITGSRISQIEKVAIKKLKKFLKARI